MMPALLTSTVTGPNVASASVTTRRQSANDVTSALMNRALSPSSAAIFSPSSSLTSVMITHAPSATKRRAWASPIPCAAPVTMATFPSRRPMLMSPVRVVYVGGLLAAGHGPALVGVGPFPLSSTDGEPALHLGSVLVAPVLQRVGDVAERLLLERPQPFEDPGRRRRVGRPARSRLKKLGRRPAHEAAVFRGLTGLVS